MLSFYYDEFKEIQVKATIFKLWLLYFRAMSGKDNKRQDDLRGFGD